MERARFKFVFFDVDSTLVTIEGIDVLARGNPEVVRLTEAAMNGEIPLDDVYGRRLEIIRPTRTEVDNLGRLYCDSLVSGADEVVSKLRSAGCDVHLVTAGIHQAILPLAERLGLPPRTVHAVEIRFDGAGNYLDYDRRSLLARSGGQELVVHALLARAKGTSAFVGDGASDLETRPVVDLFIGFGGVHTRPLVKDNADVYVDEPTLLAVLPHLFA